MGKVYKQTFLQRRHISDVQEKHSHMNMPTYGLYRGFPKPSVTLYLPASYLHQVFSLWMSQRPKLNTVKYGTHYFSNYFFLCPQRPTRSQVRKVAIICYFSLSLKT